jgi:hypothetical protein
MKPSFPPQGPLRIWAWVALLAVYSGAENPVKHPAPPPARRERHGGNNASGTLPVG